MKNGFVFQNRESGEDIVDGSPNDNGEQTNLVKKAKGLLGSIVYSEKEAYESTKTMDICRTLALEEIISHILRERPKFAPRIMCVSSREGYKIGVDVKHVTNITRLNTRYGCQAMIRFTVNEQGEWVVTRFIEDHNHELVGPEDRHLLRSVRAISNAKDDVLSSMANSGIRTIQAYSYMVEEGSGVENLGFTKKDCYNFINTKKMVLIEGGNSQSLVQYFKDKANKEDGLYYWDVQVEEDGRMANFFWRDGRSLMDYECFGDVVVFDTTYRTNRYNLICAPFVGVNHHWQNVMFGCAFLLDETTSKFEGLL